MTPRFLVVARKAFELLLKDEGEWAAMGELFAQGFVHGTFACYAVSLGIDSDKDRAVLSAICSLQFKVPPEIFDDHFRTFLVGINCRLPKDTSSFSRDHESWAITFCHTCSLKKLERESSEQVAAVLREVLDHCREVSDTFYPDFMHYLWVERWGKKALSH